MIFDCIYNSLNNDYVFFIYAFLYCVTLSVVVYSVLDLKIIGYVVKNNNLSVFLILSLFLLSGFPPMPTFLAKLALLVFVAKSVSVIASLLLLTMYFILWYAVLSFIRSHFILEPKVSTLVNTGSSVKVTLYLSLVLLMVLLFNLFDIYFIFL